MEYKHLNLLKFTIFSDFTHIKLNNMCHMPFYVCVGVFLCVCMWVGLCVYRQTINIQINYQFWDATP